MSARLFLLEAHMRQVAKMMRRRAMVSTFNGTAPGMAYIGICTRDDGPTATRIIFTRDTGHHSSGWMKNPDYERCWHLSISTRPAIVLPGVQQLAECDKPTTLRWLQAFFGDDARYTWLESAKSLVGKQAGVMHWRLFCDAEWRPILPRGEVYSTDFTEKGWRSASQVLEQDGVSIFSTVDPQ